MGRSLTNNDVFRRIRYIFNLKDKNVVAIFAAGNLQVTETQVINWLRKDEDELMKPIVDVELASFLNGFIIEKRGKREGEQPKAETILTKNLILMKLKIALKLQNDDILDLLKTTGFSVGKSELTAFFRKPEHKNYRHCKSQFLRNFLQAVQDKYKTADTKPKKHSAKNEYSPKKGDSSQTRAKQYYANPKVEKQSKDSNRKVLKLKPEDIYKNI